MAPRKLPAEIVAQTLRDLDAFTREASKLTSPELPRLPEHKPFRLPELDIEAATAHTRKIMAGITPLPELLEAERKQLVANLLKALGKGQTRKLSSIRQRAPDGVTKWYTDEHIPAGYSTRGQDLAAVRKRFGCWTKDREFMRELRRQYAPPGWKQAGPKIWRK